MLEHNRTLGALQWQQTHGKISHLHCGVSFDDEVYVKIGCLDVSTMVTGTHSGLLTVSHWQNGNAMVNRHCWCRERWEKHIVQA